MTTSEQTQKNLTLAFDLVRQALLAPEALDALATLGEAGTFVYFDPDDDELTSANAAMADRLEKNGQTVERVEVQRRMFLHPVG